MEIISVHQTNIMELCPSIGTLDEMGFVLPNENQMATIVERYGKLNNSLTNDSIIVWGNATETLAAAAVFKLIFEGHATVPFGFGGSSNPDLANAIADLAVTGHSNYESFILAATLNIGTDEEMISIDTLKGSTQAVLESVATRLGAAISVSLSSEEVRLAINYVVDRAINVVWALNGPASVKSTLRPSLGWIAVNSERDNARRPCNMPGTNWPEADTYVNFSKHGISNTIRIRYAVAGASERPTSFSMTDLPRTKKPPMISRDSLVIVFLHGHSSGLSEGGQLYEELKLASESQLLAKPIVMLSFDFPSNGYSQYFDPEELAPIETTTRYVPDHPEERRFGILEVYEQMVVSLIESIDQDLINDGQETILPRIAAVIGGSMGGNLALRLSERLVTNPWWLRNIVSWSPASIYESFGNKDYFIPSPGEEVDPIGKEALERAHQRSTHDENSDSRGEFIGLQLNGERLINDGTPEFEVLYRFLEFTLQPLIGGVLNFIPIVGPMVGPLVSGLLGPIVPGVIVGETGIPGTDFRGANTIAVKQSDQWLRAECRSGYNQATANTAFLLSLQEVYSSKRRRTHWRVAYEQLLFSHQDQVAASDHLKCYEKSTVRTLLIGGADDTTDRLTGFDIVGGVRKLAPLMRANPGKAIIIDNTGHSIHAERPKWLAREIIDFIKNMYENEIVGVSRNDTGRIERLYFTPILRSLHRDEAIINTLSTQGRYYFYTPSGEKVNIYARRFLKTTPDDNPDNNLRSLPMTSLELIRGREAFEFYGSISGFEVTHIRVRSSGPEPWNSWVSHLCNDSLNVQIPTAEAENRILNLGARYYIIFDGVEYDLEVNQYLHTTPDSSIDNNLDSIESITQYIESQI